ncbi:MAG: Clp protease ClpP [Clostridiales bacterium]|nr:Clp protease ClpP [Clostridiales bacterium]
MPQNKKFEFCNLNINSSENAELFFYGDIVSDSWDRWKWEDTCPDDVKELINDIGDKNIDIHINSPGGNVFAGFAIYNLLKNTKGKKTVYIDGVAASISSVIAMVGDEIIMPENSFLMIHKPSITLMGANADDLSDSIEILDKLEKGIIATYLTNSKDEVTEEKLAEMLAAETWLSADEAADIFDNISVSEANQAAAKMDFGNYQNYKNIPKQFKNAAKPPQKSDPDMSDFINYEKLLNIKYPKEEN